MKKSFIAPFLGLFLIIFGITVQFKSSTIASFILHQNSYSVSIDDFHFARTSLNSMGSNLFLVGCFIMLIEYSFFKLYEFKSEN